MSAMRSPESPKSQPRQSPLLTKKPVPQETERAHAARREHAERQRHFAPRLLDANGVVQRVDAAFGRRRILPWRARSSNTTAARRASSRSRRCRARRCACARAPPGRSSSVGSSRTRMSARGDGVVVAARRRRGKDRLSRRRGRPARQIEIVPHVAAHAQVAAEREAEVAATATASSPACAAATSSAASSVARALPASAPTTTHDAIAQRAPRNCAAASFRARQLAA